MTWTVSLSGTKAATVGTEATLTTDTTNATYYFEVDCGAMVSGDIVELRIYLTTLSAGTSRVAWLNTIGPSPPICPISVSPCQASNISIAVSLKQTAGTARSYPWKLLRI
jgi:hypothetical protein